MYRMWLIVMFCALIVPASGQESVKSIDGEWFVSDLDQSTVLFFKGTDGYFYSKILKSNNELYVHQVIFKGLPSKKENCIVGTFTTPKSKMKIATKVYVDNENEMRFVGKKLFITKTYKGKRIK